MLHSLLLSLSSHAFLKWQVIYYLRNSSLSPLPLNYISPCPNVSFDQYVFSLWTPSNTTLNIIQCIPPPQHPRRWPNFPISCTKSDSFFLTSGHFFGAFILTKYATVIFFFLCCLVTWSFFKCLISFTLKDVFLKGLGEIILKWNDPAWTFYL